LFLETADLFLVDVCLFVVDDLLLYINVLSQLLYIITF